ncbi:MAG: hypothetical protein HYV03_00665, partial [Deltaproteobacteria bacterium]|nr:hypothetical protein [Deltaproteobacteria bacterium]
MTRRRNVVALCLLGLVGGLIWYGCGSGGGGDTPTATPTGADSANSLSDLPATSSLVAGSSASSSEGVKSLGKTPAGTPPVLKEIGSTVSVDTVFWGGLLAQINAASAGSITGDQQLAYWHGEGACRMAQAVGYSFQNILQGGTSLCYMQNAPGAENGVNIISGDVTASNIFDQVASDKVIKVSVSNMSMPGGEGGGGGSGGPEEIFIKVYGTGSTEGGAGYAVDL